MKVIVDEIPKISKECIFSEYIQMTSKYKCMFQQGMYSRCKLDHGEKCPYLKQEEDKSITLKRESLGREIQNAQTEDFVISQMEKLVHAMKGDTNG